MTVLLDAVGLVALLAGEPAADQVESMLRRGDVAMTAINLAETLDVLQRRRGLSPERIDEHIVPLVGTVIELIDVDLTIARRAADIRARRYHRTRSPLSLADCVLLAAVGPNGSLATADEPLLAAASAEGVAVTRLLR